MKEIRIKQYVRYLFGILILIFILNKLYFRPWLNKIETPDILIVITYSIPNFIEAMVGTLIITGILFQLREYFNSRFGSLKDTLIHILALSFASAYVISQELKFHNFGGNNVYDPYDIVGSVIGLVATFILIQTYGVIEKRRDEFDNDYSIKRSMNH
jgi:hypothetical protein